MSGRSAKAPEGGGHGAVAKLINHFPRGDALRVPQRSGRFSTAAQGVSRAPPGGSVSYPVLDARGAGVVAGQAALAAIGAAPPGVGRRGRSSGAEGGDPRYSARSSLAAFEEMPICTSRRAHLPNANEVDGVGSA